MPKRNWAAPLVTENGPEESNDAAKFSRSAQQKQRRILGVLLDGVTLTRFDAERHGDHCLNSTVATLGSLGVTISRRPVVLPGRFGPVRCNCYWIEVADMTTARAVWEALT